MWSLAFVVLLRAAGPLLFQGHPFFWSFRVGPLVFNGVLRRVPLLPFRSLIASPQSGTISHVPLQHI